MKDLIKEYLQEIGRRGGQKSRRSLSPSQARDMVLVREARRAFKRFKTLCFWSFDPRLKVSRNDIPWMIEQLRKNGGRDAWEVAAKLSLASK